MASLNMHVLADQQMLAGLQMFAFSEGGDVVWMRFLQRFGFSEAFGEGKPLYLGEPPHESRLRRRRSFVSRRTFVKTAFV